YFYPGVTTAPLLAARQRAEQIDLTRSLALRVGGELAGQATLALRGDRAWCGGFGVTAPFRGRGLARPLIAALIDQAREAGARRFGLEVLTRNEKAIKAYRGAGLSISRDLLIFQWAAEGSAPVDAADAPGIADAAPRELLRQFDALHPAPAAWQRDLPALLVKQGLQGLALTRGGELAGYALYSLRESALRIEDLAARDAGRAAELLRALQRRAATISSVNEPDDSPLTAAFAACGFRESDRQHEMALDL
ncbi:MAG TPA: GNAT family N-acetyltransferase, partial [Herpetosiphonaceae bacterium]